jgi:hypothetical protein
MSVELIDLDVISQIKIKEVYSILYTQMNTEEKAHLMHMKNPEFQNKYTYCMEYLKVILKETQR